MDGTNSLPNDATQCHQLLVAAYQQSVQLEQQVAGAKRRATQAERRVAESEQQVAELGRVLDETAASFEELKQEHAATLDELAWYKRWAFGRRRERFSEGEGQGHLFDLDPPAANESEDSAIRATCMPMRTRVTTRSFWTQDRALSKLPVGRMRGAGSSMP